MKFGLMFFAASDDSLRGDKYRLVLESARFGDRFGFSSVWTAERHFTRFGGLYPNPAVLHAALASITTRIRLQAGSVVAPLHHPLRIAEEWSVVDNLSNGRIGVSFASGWNPDDFVFFPEHYTDRHDRLFDVMRQVQGLWRGDAFDGANGVGQPARVRVFPKPVQAELPVWVTAAGNPKTFERAGASGAHVLTHLLDQDEETLASKIALYRRARAEAGFDPSTGIVSLMVHTLVGAEPDIAREQARGPYCSYIKSNIGLFKGLEQSRGRDVDLSKLSEADLDEFVNFLYERFASSRGLIGTPESCAPLVARLESAGVNELACLLDFGPSDDLILANLPNLARLKDLCDGGADAQPTRRTGEAVVELSLAGPSMGRQFHPASLDACAKVLASAAAAASATSAMSSELLVSGAPAGVTSAGAYIATGFDSLEISGLLAGPVRVQARVRRADEPVVGDVDVFDMSGGRLARIEGLRLMRREATALPTVDGVDALVYERAWQESARSAGAAADARGRWRVVTGAAEAGARGNSDAAAIAAELARAIDARGGECVVVADASDATGVTDATGARAAHEDLRGIIYLGALDTAANADASAKDIDADVTRALAGALCLANLGGAAPIFIVTRGAQSVSAGGHATNVMQAPLWGFGRALAVERPGALGALVDLDPSSSPAHSADAVMRVLLGDRADDMVAFRGDAMFVPRLRRLTIAPTASDVAFGPDETIVVTGGTGGLGVRVIDWLVSRGARHIVACSRHGARESAERRFNALRASGVSLELWPVDVADVDGLRSRMAAVPATRPITGVFHLAGVLDDGLLAMQTAERFSAVMASKVSGAWNLHQLTRALPLRHFVMFSSVSSILPAPGQSSYAAANAFLDALAHERRAHGLPALAVNWGPWSDAGHAETNYGRAAHAQLASLGIGAIAPNAGVALLERLMTGDRAQIAAAVVDWAQLSRTDPAAARLGLLSELLPAAAPAGAAATEAPPARGSSPLLTAMAALPSPQRRPHLLGFLSDTIIAALKLRTGEPIDPKARLFDVGLDSIVALELKDRLERAVGVPLSATLLFVYPTLDALCDYLLEQMAPALAADADAEDEDELTRRLLKEIEASRGA